jgi:hypothetical protein
LSGGGGESVADEQLDSLVAMGFDDGEAAAALIRYHGDMDRVNLCPTSFTL